MWNNISFRDCPDAFFQYKFDTDMFFIKCEMYQPSLSGGSVCVHIGDVRCVLGSLKNDKGLLFLDRIYPLSFLSSNGIDKDAITHFSVETSDGTTITSYSLGDIKSSLDSARKLLDNMKAPLCEDAEKIANATRQKISFLPKVSLPFLPDFKWHMVDNTQETFSLSAIWHIISSSSFLQSFENTHLWFIGYREDDNIFSVCMKTGVYLPNPMENALDCCVSFDDEGERYYAVGIGLFDDGQYFVRL